MTQQKMKYSLYTIRRIFTIVTLVVVLLELVSCASKTYKEEVISNDIELPSFILNPAEKYPPDKYMVAVGNGDTSSDAKQSALHSLAQQLKVEVKGTFYLNSEDTLEESDDASNAESNTKLTEDIVTSTSQELLGVEFADTFTDPDGLVYVIAYIDRIKTGQIYRDKIQSLEFDISELIKSANKTYGFKKYAKLSQANKLCLKEEQYIETLGILHAELAKIAKLGIKNTSQQISLDLTKTAQSIPLFTDTIFRSVNGSVPKYMKQQIKDEVIAALTKMQFTPNTNQAISSSPYIVQTSISWEERPDDRYPNITWTVNTAIKSNNQVILSFTEKKQSKGPSIGKASDFAKEDIILAINKGLYSTISNSR